MSTMEKDKVGADGEQPGCSNTLYYLQRKPTKPRKLSPIKYSTVEKSSDPNQGSAPTQMDTNAKNSDSDESNSSSSTIVPPSPPPDAPNQSQKTTGDANNVASASNLEQPMSADQNQSATTTQANTHTPLPSFQSAFGSTSIGANMFQTSGVGGYVYQGFPQNYAPAPAPLPTGYQPIDPNINTSSYYGYQPQHPYPGSFIPGVPPMFSPPHQNPFENADLSQYVDNKYEGECLATEIYDFLKTCASELGKVITSGPAAPHLTSVLLPIEEMLQVIAEGEEQFHMDLLENDHDNHNGKICDVVKNGKRSKKVRSQASTSPAKTSPGKRKAPKKIVTIDLD